MTFSVDSDFWPFQSDSRRDGFTRTEASEGRGKAFASSLLGASERPEAPGIDTRAEGDALMLSSLTLARASIAPANDVDVLEQVAPPVDAPLPDPDFTEVPALSVVTEVTDLKASHLAELPSAGGGTTPALSQNALPDSSIFAEALSLADSDLFKDAPTAETIPAYPPPPALPSAELTQIALLSETSTEAPDANPATLPDRKPPAPEATVVEAEAPPYDTAALSQATLVTPFTPPMLAEGQIASPPGIEPAAASLPALPQPPQPASGVVEPAGAGSRAVQVPAEAMVPPPPATPAAIVSPPPIKPVSSVAAAPAADTRQSRPAYPEPEMQPAPLDDTFVDTIETAAPAAGVSASAAQPQGGAGGDVASGSPIGPLSAGGVPQGQPTGQIAILPASTPLTPTHAVLIAAPAHLPDILARATRDGGQDDRITVQLDPPELGRISIDFKFDGQGLQHVTITAESPEAMRQLRQMHFELVQALERNGLSGQDMSFQHQNPQQNEGWGQQPKIGGSRADTPALTGSNLIIAADNTPNRQSASSGRLDIRL